MNKASTVLLIFAKAPIAGQVNTRLIPAIGEQRATQLQHDLIVHRMQQFHKTKNIDVQLYCTPDTGHPLFQQCRHDYGISLHVQSGNHLGQRMSSALYDALQQYDTAVLIGTDAPAVDADCVNQAVQAATHCNVVLQPATDGGYVLIAMRQHHETVFDNIDWGSDQVLIQTRKQLAASNLHAIELPVCWDIDTFADYQRYQKWFEHDCNES